ncbi:phosphatidylinositol glycan anchor biosynthesis class U protein-like [Montipora foliosa]|uniref:phosphatidylinositol glycan anchor biosynthesis class U protein-like n=1 Tax=Montipora foliosa TaxID=591990 RepID=UPI0035F1D422
MADFGRVSPLFLLALMSRLFLIYSPVKFWLINRIELSTPLTSWSRVQEGLYLVENGVSPYSGDVVHESPLVLAVFLGLQQVSELLFPLLFVVGDLLIGWLLYKLAVLHCNMLQEEQTKHLKHYATTAETVLIKEESLNDVPLLVSSIYLLNPYTIGSCVAHSTLVFTNLSVTIALFYAMKGSVLLSTLGVALGAYHSLYPITLLPPVVLILIKVRSVELEFNRKVVVFALSIIGSFVMWTAFLLVLSYQMFNSWDFLIATHGFILQVSDLTPNMGLFWYFFTEMFDHFRNFFLWVFQLNAFIYCIPLTIKLRKNPTLLACMMSSVMAVMKSYPALGDSALSFALLALWVHVFPYLRNTFLVSCMLLCSSFLAPVFWHLWIYAGSANANFFFATTLAYSTAQILLMSDVLFAFLRREYDLYHGIYPPIMQGEPGVVILR